MYRIADTHTHLYFPGFDDDRAETVDRCRSTGVQLQVQVGCDEISSLAALKLAQEYEDMFCTLGVHPCDVHECFEVKPSHRYAGFETYDRQARTFSELFALFEDWYEANRDLVLGFGETGVDLYHHDTPEHFALQREAFLGQLDLCRQFDVPVVLHTRNATAETMEILDHFGTKGLRGVWHCFCEDLETAKIITQKYGFSLGIGGIVTYPNAGAMREAVAEIPLEYLVTETDSPFLTPQSRRADTKRNESSFLPEVVERIALLKGQSVEAVAAKLYQNAKDLFRV